jgi:hypothetical protein
MSSRSAFKPGREPQVRKPLIGRHARRIARREARSMAGDFSAALRSRPLDVVYRRLSRRVLAALQTRHGQ